MSQTKQPRGRPVDPAEQQRRKNALLDAASDLLKTHSYRSVTIRQIASAADMKSAMISYYFGSKEGLLTALVERIALNEFQLLSTSSEQDNPLKSCIHSLLTNISNNCHVANLIHDELLSQEGSLRDQLIELLPKRIAKALTELIVNLQAEGKINPAQNPKWLAFSLMSMIVTPFIAEPIRKDVWQIENEDLASEAWAEHIYNLFLAGAGTQKL